MFIERYLKEINKTMKNICSLIIACLFLAQCATQPKNITNACAILEQNEGLIGSWDKSLKKTEKKYGIPAHIILATVYVESSFRPYAKTKRTKLWGFIPWKRQSSAYGYAQVLDKTWEHYKKATKRNFLASRANFADAIDFIGWYYKEAVRRNHIAPTDCYNLYLNYYMGQGAYARNKGQASPAIRKAALRAAEMAKIYEKQLRLCGRR